MNNNDNIREPEELAELPQPETAETAEEAVTSPEETTEETSEEKPAQEELAEDTAEVEEEAHEESCGEIPAAEQPRQQPPYPPYQPPYPNYQQPYQQPYQNYQPPYQAYQPWVQPPAPKAKMKAGTRVFIICMCVLTVLGFGAFGLSISLYNSAKEESHPSIIDYNEFYGEFFKDFEEHLPEEHTPQEDNSAEPGLSIKEPEYPDIEIPQVSSGIIINSEPDTPELTAEEVYKKVIHSTVTVDVDIAYSDGSSDDSTGTGIIISEDGFVITNSHVVANSKSVTVNVITYDGTEHPAIVVGLDKTTDLAVLKMDGTGFIPAEFGSSDDLNIGEWVIAIGNPAGTEFSGSLTRGVISGLDRKVGSYSANGMTYLQTDAAINPGNSGGPLVNMYGQVIGINSSKIVAEYYEGMGFAIPSSKAKDIIDQLLTKGYVQGRVRLGITGQNVLYGYPEGVTIIAIDENSSFAGTEAQVGDVITAVDGQLISGLTDLSNEFLKFAPGDKVQVTLYRSSTGKTFNIDVVLLEDKGETQR